MGRRHGFMPVRWYLVVALPAVCFELAHVVQLSVHRLELRLASVASSLVFLMEHVAVIADQGFGGRVFDPQGLGSLDIPIVTSLVPAFSSNTRWKSTSLAFSGVLA